MIEVGKRGGCRSTTQAFIEHQMIQLAQAGRIVARVKGGDPFVFGRGGEEVAALRHAGVAVEVISGITAGIAAPAALGIPVTHRSLTHGVTLMTGHTRDGSPPDWSAAVRLGISAGGIARSDYETNQTGDDRQRHGRRAHARRAAQDRARLIRDHRLRRGARRLLPAAISMLPA